MRESEVAQSCPTLSDPMDWNPPGFSVHGISQARALEWGAIAFSNFISNSEVKEDWEAMENSMAFPQKFKHTIAI